MADSLGAGDAMRKPISKKLRFEVFKRDGFVCQYCGAHPPGSILHVDHIHPVADGGKNEIDNLVTSCEACNLGKGARALGSAPQPLKDKAEAVRESEEQLRGYHKILEEKRTRIERESWLVAQVFSPGCTEFNKRDMISIRMFVERLGYFETLDSAERADAKRPYSYNQAFKYFCGTCWGKIRDMGGKNG